MLRLPIQPIWQRVSQWPVWEPNRLAIASSILLHAVILSFVRVPEPTPPEVLNDQLVPLVSLSPELEADLPSIKPLLPTELPPLATTTPPPLPLTGIEPPPLSFAPLAPLPPLSPPLLPNPVPVQPLPPLWQLPPPTRPLPGPNEDVAVAPELVLPTPASPPNEPIARTTAEAAAALSRWFNETRSTLNTTDIQVNFGQRIADFYPQEACGDRLQGETTVAVVVTPQGELLPANAAPETGLLTRNPQIIRSSGSPLLDQAALEQVRKQAFEATGKYQALAITFAFEYRPEMCPPAASPPRQQPTAPAPSPSEAHQASPPAAEDAEEATPAPTPPPPGAAPPAVSPEPSGTDSSSVAPAASPPATSPE
ncbi:MAG TPA: energy transducer TonB [Thermosynechococcus sp. M3746_W2019_013]|uniref:energy transducer TonB n=1 Tax=Thermosynechococcus sp. M3746_W2019_013 TaxID=2747806 RepID=UPI0019F9729D|nr:hypothetical protein [Thermosynechococcus sp. M3746_W2019_013]HIK22404.1 energy transducer TonB [Thermosynechococcus sp. M3746_W2019_013]